MTPTARTAITALTIGVLLVGCSAGTSAHPVRVYEAQRGPFTSFMVSTPAPSPFVTPDALETLTPRPTPRPTPKPTTRPVIRFAGTGLSGQATWYSYVVGQAAAGPRLRAALGPGWRGRVVTVCATGTRRCITVTLSDWCACQPPTRLIDLDVRSFAALADPSRGVISVTVTHP